MKPIANSLSSVLATCASLLFCTAASAHVVLQDPAAAAGSGYRATFLVGHGCEGTATTAIKVRIPEDFQGAKPMPKAGWTLNIVSAPLAKPYSSHGKRVTEDVAEISWTANGPGSALPDAWYEEFVLRGTTPGQAGLLWFKVLQTCEKGQNDWSETPASGSSTKGLKAPAALLELMDTGASGHQH
jgi:periplasmic copper chaperone A